MEKLLVALAAAVFLLVAASQPLGHQEAPATLGPAPAATGVETAQATATPAPAPAATGSGETYYDYALGKEWKREDLPFFLRDYTQYPPGSDPLAAAQEAWRFYNDTKDLWDTVSVNFHGGLVEREWTVGDRTIRVPYTQYFVRDGIYYCSTASGSIPLYEQHPLWGKVYGLWQKGTLSDEELLKAKRGLSRLEFEKIDKFFYLLTMAALEDLDRDIIEITRMIRPLMEEKLGKGVLERTVPWDVDPPLTVAEVLGLELYDAERYMPDVYYFGPISAWGFCISGPNIPLPGGIKPERRIAIHPQALGFEWILGKHNTILHELVHAWQSFPLGWWYDVELWNELYSTGMDVYPLDFLNHPYLERLRRIALRYWSFDADYASEVLWAFRVGRIYEINPDRFYELYDKVQVIYRELKSVTPYVYRVFYSDPIFFITISDFMKDDAFALDLIFASLYPATCLGSPEDSPEEAALKTQKWVKAHMDQIRKAFDATLRKMKDKQRKRKEEGGDDSDRLPSSVLAVAWWNRLPPQAQEALMRAYERGGIDAVVDLLLEGGDH